MAVYFGQEKGLGDLLGAGLGKGLGALISQKMERIQKRSGLESLGLTPEKASGLSRLPGKIGEIATQQELRGQQKLLQQQELIRNLRGQGSGQVVPKTLSENLGTDTVKKTDDNGGFNIDEDIRKKLEQRDSSTNKTIGSFLDNLQSTGDVDLSMKLTSAQDKANAASIKGEESRKTGAINSARKEMEKLEDVAETNRRTFIDYDQIAKSVKTSGRKWAAGIPFSIAKSFGFEKGLLDPALAVANKAFEAQPIKAMKMISAQALRLSKVFESLKGMHGSLENNPDAIQAIARVKMAEAKVDKILASAQGKALAKYVDSDLKPPSNLKSLVAKGLKSKVEPYLRETEMVLSDEILRKYPEISEFGDGAVFKDKDNNVTYKLGKIGKKKAWIVQ